MICGHFVGVVTAPALKVGSLCSIICKTPIAIALEYDKLNLKKKKKSCGNTKPPNA